MLVVTFAGGGCDRPDTHPGAGAAPAGLTTPIANPEWTIVEMATAHGALTIEVDAPADVDADAVARLLIEPIQPEYAEILVYFYERGRPTDLPMYRVSWTASNGYQRLAY